MIPGPFFTSCNGASLPILDAFYRQIRRTAAALGFLSELRSGEGANHPYLMNTLLSQDACVAGLEDRESRKCQADENSPSKSDDLGTARTFYKALPCVGGTWGFRTPTRRDTGYASDQKAQAAADAARNEDLQESQNGTGPIAGVLRSYFQGQP